MTASGKLKKVVISVLGRDRPGIIAAVSRTLSEQDCNIENVNQTILQSEFSGIFIAAIPVEVSIESLQAELKRALKPLGMHIHVKPLETHRPDPRFLNSEPFVFTTRGPDNTGLVAAITEIIARYGVNVTNLQAVFRGGENPSDNIMIYQVDIPSDTDHQALYRELREKAASLGLEISIQHRRIFETLNRI